MRRVPSTPRPDALDVVRAEGLTYASERNTAGEDVPYWTEHVCYVFESEDIDVLEQVTQELHEMSVAAGRRFLYGGARRLGSDLDRRSLRARHAAGSGRGRIRLLL